MYFLRGKVTEGDFSLKQQGMCTGGKARPQGQAATCRRPNSDTMVTVSITRHWANDGLIKSLILALVVIYNGAVFLLGEILETRLNFSEVDSLSVLTQQDIDHFLLLVIIYILLVQSLASLKAVVHQPLYIPLPCPCHVSVC